MSLKYREINLPGKGNRNHANYIDEKGHYEVARYLDDMKTKFQSMSNVGTGKLCPHISNEVDCE